MTGRFAKLAVPFEDLFDPDIIGDGPQAWPFTDAGTPLRFAHVQYGQRRADVGFTVKIGGTDVDVATLWAAKGTAVYVNTAAIPGTVRHETDGSPPSITAVAGFAFNRNGTVTFQPEDYPPTNYVFNAAATVGDGYRVRFRLLSRSQQGTLAGTFDAYMTVDQTRQVTMTYVRTQAGQLTAWAEIAIDFMRISDGAVLHTFGVRIEASASIS